MKTVWECAQFFWTLLISLHAIFHVWQWKTRVFGEKDTHLLFIAYVREVGMPFRKRSIPEGRVLLPYVSLQKKCMNVLLPKAVRKSFFSPLSIHEQKCCEVSVLWGALCACNYAYFHAGNVQVFCFLWKVSFHAACFVSRKVKSQYPWLIFLAVGKNVTFQEVWDACFVLIIPFST